MLRHCFATALAALLAGAALADGSDLALGNAAYFIGDRQFDQRVVPVDATLGYKWVVRVQVDGETKGRVKIGQADYVEGDKVADDTVCARLLVNGMKVGEIKRSDCGREWTSPDMDLVKGGYRLVVEAVNDEPTWLQAMMVWAAGAFTFDLHIPNLILRDLHLVTDTAAASVTEAAAVTEAAPSDSSLAWLATDPVRLGDDAPAEGEKADAKPAPRAEFTVKVAAAGDCQLRIGTLSLVIKPDEFPPATCGRILADDREVDTLKGRDNNQSVNSAFFQLTAGEHKLAIESAKTEAGDLQDMLLAQVCLFSPKAAVADAPAQPAGGAEQGQPATDAPKTDTPAATGELTDDLDKDNGHWPVDETAYFKEGAYHVKGALYHTAYDFKNGYVSIKAGPRVGPADDSYGLVFRQTGKGGYAILISGVGQWTLLKFDGEKVETLLDWTQDDAIKTGEGDVNTIGAACAGGYLQVFINDQFVGQRIDDSYPLGGIGPVSGKDLDVAFTKLSVTGTAPVDVSVGFRCKVFDSLAESNGKWTTSKTQFSRDQAYHVKTNTIQSNYLFQDGYAAIETQFVSGKKDEGYGLAFRVGGGGDKPTGYLLLISREGRWRLMKFAGLEAEGMKTLSEGTGPVNDEDGAWNEVGVYCEGSTIDIYINEEYAETVTDDTYDAGGMGLVTGQGIHVAFRNLRADPVAPGGDDWDLF